MCTDREEGKEGETKAGVRRGGRWKGSWNTDVLKRPGIDPVNYIFLASFKKKAGKKFRVEMYSHLRLLFFPWRSSADRNESRYVSKRRMSL